MRIRLLFICLSLAASAFAQEGHPLTGRWIGDWGPSATQRNHITLIMSFDGDKVTGVLNPGPDSATLDNIFVDVTNWTVRIEADTKDQSGKLVRISAEGKLEDLGSPKRRMIGTWSQGDTRGTFKITRD